MFNLATPKRAMQNDHGVEVEVTMASRAEQSISRLLRAILTDLPNGANIVDSEQFRGVLSGLEYFVPEVLGEVHPEWNYEGLDGILPLVARKTRQGEAEIFGLCIIISDQTVTPIHLSLQVSSSVDAVSWLECRLGEAGPHGMMRTPYELLNSTSKRLHALECRSDMIDWVYKVAFGERRPDRT
jgi:hypothetical protein